MIKSLFNIIVGILLCSISFAQHNRPEESIGIGASSINIVTISGSESDDPGFALPASGDVVGEDKGTIIYKGTVKKNRLHGDWQSWYENKQACDSGKLVKGIPTGEWKHWNRNGQLMALRTYDASKLERVKNEIRRNHPKDVVFPLTALHRKNNKQASHYMQSKYSFDFGGRRHPESLQEAVAHNTAPGNKYRPLFDECLHHGLYMNFFDNGITRDSGFYKYGLKEGVWLHKEADGTYQVGLYHHGIKQREWKQYDANDKLLYLHFYDRKGHLEWTRKIKK